MALQLLYSTQHGLDLKEAYVRIDYMSIKKDKLSVTLGIYKDVESSDKYPIVNKSFDLNLDISDKSKNYHVQTYESLKKMDEFKGSIDV